MLDEWGAVAQLCLEQGAKPRLTAAWPALKLLELLWLHGSHEGLLAREAQGLWAGSKWLISG